MGVKLCPLDPKVEDHEHVFRHCFFTTFMFDMLRRAFGVVASESGGIEPSRLIRDSPLLLLTTTQRLLLWVGLKVQWNLRCRAKYQRKPSVLDEFIAGWAVVRRRWRSEKNMSCSGRDLQQMVGILDGWFDDPQMPRIFHGRPQPPRNARPVKQKDKLEQKEKKGGWGYRDAAVLRLQKLDEEGWTVANSDGGLFRKDSGAGHRQGMTSGLGWGPRAMTRRTC